MAIRGITGTIDGIDYRNVPVVAAMNKVPGTQWYNGSQDGSGEVCHSLNSQIRMIVIILHSYNINIRFLSRTSHKESTCNILSVKDMKMRLTDLP